MPDIHEVEPLWDLLDQPKPFGFLFLILACLLIELVIYLNFWTAIVLTPFLYLIIVLAGLWDGRKTFWLAVFSGLLVIINTYLHTSTLTPDSILNAILLCLVAFFVGTLVEQKRRYRAENLKTQEKFKKLDEDKRAFQEELNVSRISCDTASRKLKFLSGILHHDIFNNMSALIGSVDLLKTKIADPELLVDIDRSEKIAYTIRRQIEFARTYERIGTSAPQWLNVDTQIHALLSSVPQKEITFSLLLQGLEIFVDPLFEKVFVNLINNSLNHGVRVSHISVSYLPFNRDIAIVYEDDGIGIHAVDKLQIFEKGVGKDYGFGLFLSQEILSITGLTVKECGVYGVGARFEIFVPEGKFRFT